MLKHTRSMDLMTTSAILFQIYTTKESLIREKSYSQQGKNTASPHNAPHSEYHNREVVYKALLPAKPASAFRSPQFCTAFSKPHFGYRFVEAKVPSRRFSFNFLIYLRILIELYTQSVHTECTLCVNIQNRGIHTYERILFIYKLL